jgi:hypothetical protein
MLEPFLEFILQLVVEFFVNGLGLGLSKILPEAVVGAIGYTLIGAMLGGLSLLIWPHGFLHSTPARVANLIVSPILSGGLFAALGQWRMRRGRPASSLEKFANGFCFSLSFGAVRFALAR